MGTLTSSLFRFHIYTYFSRSILVLRINLVIEKLYFCIDRFEYFCADAYFILKEIIQNIKNIDNENILSDLDIKFRNFIITFLEKRIVDLLYCKNRKVKRSLERFCIMIDDSYSNHFIIG